MKIQRINRDDGLKVWASVYNSVTTTLALGSACVWDYTTDKDGVTVILPTTALLKMFAGVVSPKAIVGKTFGLVQVYGHNADALVDGTTDVVAGDPLTIADGSANFAKALALAYTTGDKNQYSYIVVAGQAYTTAAAAAKKVFIRGM